MSDRTRGIFILGGMAVSGVALTIWSVLLWAEALSTLTWPSVQGEVISAEVIAREISQRHSSQDSISYFAKIAYRYQVDGIVYENNKPKLGGWGGHRFERRAHKDLRPYEVGASVTVYYREEDPQQAYLETGSFGPAALATVFACGLLFLPLLVVAITRTTDMPL